MSAVWPCPNLVSSSLRFSDSLFVTFLTSSMPPAVLHSLRSFLPVLVSLVSLSFLGPSVTHSVPSDVPAARGDEWRTEGRNERDWGPGMVAGKVGSVSLCSLFTFLSLHHRPSGPSLHSLPLRVRSLRDVPTACTEWGKNRRIRRWMTNGGTGGRYQSYRRLFQFLYDSVLRPPLVTRTVRLSSLYVHPFALRSVSLGTALRARNGRGTGIRTQVQVIFHNRNHVLEFLLRNLWCVILIITTLLTSFHYIWFIIRITLHNRFLRISLHITLFIFRSYFIYEVISLLRDRI